MDEKVLLSIVIPVYNLEKYIVPCIDSIIENKGVSKDSFEVIVVNDGSTDNTPALVEEYIKGHIDFSIYLINQKNQGVSVARNVGLLHAKGKFVWFVDGDDALSCDAMAVIEQFRNRNIDVIQIGDPVYNVLFDDDSVIPSYNSFYKMEEGHFIDAYKLLGKKYWHDCTRCIWRRDFLIVKGLEFPVGIFHNEDYCFLVQSLLLAESAYVNLSFRFYLYRGRVSSVSRGFYDFVKLDKYTRDRLEVLDKLLKIEIQDTDKKFYLEDFLNRYVYSILWICCLQKKAPLFLILYCLGRLKRVRHYPIKLSSLCISWVRKLMLSSTLVFVISCMFYRVLRK